MDINEITQSTIFSSSGKKQFRPYPQGSLLDQPNLSLQASALSGQNDWRTKIMGSKCWNTYKTNVVTGLSSDAFKNSYKMIT